MKLTIWYNDANGNVSPGRTPSRLNRTYPSYAKRVRTRRMFILPDLREKSGFRNPLREDSGRAIGSQKGIIIYNRDTQITYV